MLRLTCRLVAGALPIVVLLSALARPGRAEDGPWLTDFEAAKAKAKAEKKLLLLDFTGSDWCVWCKHLKTEVFDKEPFKSEAPKQFVLVELDFPQETKLPEKLRAQNEKIHKQYKVRGLPTVLLLDAEGSVIAHTGYRPGGSEKYVERLGKLIKLHETVVQMRSELAKTEGLARAKLLDRLVVAHVELETAADDVANWTKEILALDSDNKAGLKAKYEIRELLARFAKLLQAGKLDEAEAVIEKVLAVPNLSGVQKQEAYFAQSSCLEVKGDLEGCTDSLKKALEAAPESPKATHIKFMLQRLEPIVKLHAEALKLKAQLEKAEGPDRLKLLEKVLDTYTRLGNRVAGKDRSEDVEKWMEEALRLDADNKAGLKAKYECPLLMIQGEKLFRTRNPAKAQVLFEKVLALSGLTPDQVHRATLMKANCYLAQRNYQAAVDCVKEALKTAPKGPATTILKAVLAQAEKGLQAQQGSKEKKETPAEGKSAAGDPFQVPNGSVEELFKYVERLKRERCRENNFQAMMEFRRKVCVAAVEAAEKIQAAADDQKAAALKLKLEMLTSLPLFMVDDKLRGKLEELIAQLEQAKLPQEARKATSALLACKLHAASARGPEELEQVIGKVKDFFQSGPLDSGAIHLAINAGRAAEYSGRAELAAKTYRDWSKLFAVQKDKELVAAAARFEGAARRMALTESPMIVEGMTLDGKPLDWSKYQGKVVLIDFWATWCGPCRAELPNVKKHYDAYHDRGFEVVGISLDQKRADVEQFQEKEKLPWTITWDESWKKTEPASDGDQAAREPAKATPRQLANYYGIFGVPTAILLGKDGKAVSLNARGDALARDLEKLLGPAEKSK